MFHVSDNLSPKLLSIDRECESNFVELNLKRSKWLISYSNNPNRSNSSSNLESLSRNLDLYSSKHDNYLEVGSCNASVEKANVKDICQRISLKNLMKDSPCYKSLT